MQIRTAVIPVMPYAFPPKDANSTFTGVVPNMLELLSQKLNFTYEISSPPDNCSVSMKLDDGSWTSVRGMIDKNQTDLVFGPEVLIEEQLRGVQFGTYYFTYSLIFFASAGGLGDVDFSKIVLAFDIEIWYILLSLIVILAVSNTIFDISHQVFKGDSTINKLGNLERNFWMFLATFFLEGTPRMPVLHKSRFIFGVWLMAVLIMMNAFSCQFKTALISRGADDTMYSLKDLSERPELITYIRKSGFLEKVFEDSPVEEYQQIWKNILANGKKGLIHITRFFDRDLYDDTKAGKAVVLSPGEITKMVVQALCPTMTGKRSFYFINEPVLWNIGAYYATPHFPSQLIPELNKRIRWIVEGHLFARWVQSYHRDYERLCLTRENIIRNENTDILGLKLEHILPIVYVTLAMQGLALCVLLGEIVTFKIKGFK